MAKETEINYLDRYIASEQDINEFEQLIGVRLPSDYREFLLKYGGGELDEPYYSFKMTRPGDLEGELTEWEGLGGLSSFNPEGINDLPTNYKYMSSEEREFPYIPSDMIVIGGSGGSCLLLGIKGKHRGKVFFWHADLFHGDEQGSETYDNISFVSNTFEEFIKSLYVDS